MRTICLRYTTETQCRNENTRSRLTFKRQAYPEAMETPYEYQCITLFFPTTQSESEGDLRAASMAQEPITTFSLE